MKVPKFVCPNCGVVVSDLARHLRRNRCKAVEGARALRIKGRMAK